MSSSNNNPEQKYKPVGSSSLAEEFAKNDDIVDYIQDNSLEKLKAKYAEADEVSSLREIKYDHSSIQDVSSQKSTTRHIRHDVLESQLTPKPITKFQTTTSRYDNDKVLFRDIRLNEKKKEPLKEEPPVQKKRGRPPKKTPVEKQTSSITDKYNTNTRVIFVDDKVDDGIKRTDEIEVSSAFANKPSKKLLGLFKRKGE